LLWIKKEIIIERCYKNGMRGIDRIRKINIGVGGRGGRIHSLPHYGN